MNLIRLLHGRGKHALLKNRSEENEKSYTMKQNHCVRDYYNNLHE